MPHINYRNGGLKVINIKMLNAIKACWVKRVLQKNTTGNGNCFMKNFQMITVGSCYFNAILEILLCHGILLNRHAMKRMKL